MQITINFNLLEIFRPKYLFDATNVANGKKKRNLLKKDNVLLLFRKKKESFWSTEIKNMARSIFVRGSATAKRHWRYTLGRAIEASD